MWQRQEQDGVNALECPGPRGGVCSRAGTQLEDGAELLHGSELEEPLSLWCNSTYVAE